MCRLIGLQIFVFFEKLRYYKLINGLTIKQLAKEIGCHHEQLMDWMSGKVRPVKKNLEMINGFVI